VKRLGQSFALVLAGVLFWGLAVVHPSSFWQAREGVLREEPERNAIPRIYQLLSQADRLRARMRTSEVIGYVSEGEIDTRVRFSPSYLPL
jgi:hypothetical protein